MTGPGLVGRGPGQAQQGPTPPGPAAPTPGTAHLAPAHLGPAHLDPAPPEPVLVQEVDDVAAVVYGSHVLVEQILLPLPVLR